MALIQVILKQWFDALRHQGIIWIDVIYVLRIQSPMFLANILILTIYSKNLF